MALFDVSSVTGNVGRRQREDVSALFTVKRSAWHGGNPAAPEPRVDLTDAKPGYIHRGIVCHHVFRRTPVGLKLSEMKSDIGNAAVMGEWIAREAVRLLGYGLRDCGWAVCCPPGRRHREENFGMALGADVAERLGVAFYGDVAEPPRTRQRIGVTYVPLHVPEEGNLLIVDDIVTTGSTLKSMEDMLRSLGKVTLNIVGVNNA